MNIRLVAVVAAVFAFTSLVACVPSPTELCKSGVATVCDRGHECTPEASKVDFWKGIFGNDAADCKTKLEAASKCAEKTTQDELCTTVAADGGVKTGTFDLGKASDCKNATLALSCDDYNDPNKVPAACAGRCTY